MGRSVISDGISWNLMGSTSQMLEVEPLLREVLDGGEEQPGIALLNPSDQSLVITQFHWAQESDS